MNIEELKNAIRILKNLLESQRSELDPVQTDNILRESISDLETLQADIESYQSESQSNLATPMEEDQIGIDDDGAVKHRKKFIENIQKLAERVKKAQINHRKKKRAAAEYLNQFFPDLKLKASDGMKEYVKHLEITRRYLITIKKHLGRLNVSSADRQFQLLIEKEKTLKSDYYAVLDSIVGEDVIIKFNTRKGQVQRTTRYYYNTLLTEDRELDEDSYIKINRINEMRPETVDYYFKSDEPDPKPLLVYYQGDDQEPLIMQGPDADRRTGRRLFTAVEAEYAAKKFLRQNTSRARQPKKIDGLNLKKKKEASEKVLTALLSSAEVDGGTHARASDYAKVIQTCFFHIKTCRIYITELLESYRQRHNQNRFIAEIPSLGKSLEYVAERLSNWEGSLLRVNATAQTLTALSDESDEALFKTNVIQTVHQMLQYRMGGIYYDHLLDKLETAEKTALERDIGDRESLKEILSHDPSALAVFTYWLFKKLVNQGDEIQNQYTDEDEQSVTETYHPADLVYEWDRQTAKDYCIEHLEKSDVEKLRTFALLALHIEVMQLSKLIKWARGDMAERKQIDWVALGKEMEDYVKQARGVLVFAEKFEGSYKTMRTLISYILFGLDPEKEVPEDDETPWHKHLYVGEGTLAFQIGVKVEASLKSYLKASAKIAYQVVGTISQDDDRRVRHKGCHSLIFKTELSVGTPEIPDIMENQLAVEALNMKLSAALDATLGSVARVSVYESHLQMAAIWAQTVVKAQLYLLKPFNWMAHPFDSTKKYKVWGGEPETKTQQEILDDFVGSDSKLKKDFDLLTRPRVKALVLAGPSAKISGDFSALTYRGHKESLGHKESTGKFRKTTYDSEKLARESMIWRQRPVDSTAKQEVVAGKVKTNTWSRSKPVSAYRNVDVTAVWKKEAEAPTEENPLNILPVPSTATETLLTGSFSFSKGTLGIDFAHIDNHPNPDNDGMYMKLSVSRAWGGSVGSDLSPVGLSFKKTNAKKFDPIKLRRQFNRMAALAHWYYEGHVGRLPEPASDGSRPTGENIRKWEEFGDSAFGKMLKAILATLSVYGNFDLNFIYTEGTGFEVQYGRIWRTYEVGIDGSAPVLPFVAVDTSLTGLLKHCPYETLGLKTVSYILTVYNGFRKRLGEDNSDWETFRDYHLDELHAFFNLLQPGYGSYQEIEPDKTPEIAQNVPVDSDVTSKKEALAQAAGDLIGLTDVTLAAHYKDDELEKKVQNKIGSQEIQIGHVARNLMRRRRTVTRLVTVQHLGAAFIQIADHTAYTASAIFNLDNYQITKTDPIQRGKSRPFFVRPDNPYLILWSVTRPEYFKGAKLELLDKAKSVVWEHEILPDDAPFLAYKGTDLKSRTNDEQRAIEKKYTIDRSLFETKYGRHYYDPEHGAKTHWESDQSFFIQSLAWDGTINCQVADGKLSGGTKPAHTDSPFCLRIVLELVDCLSDSALSIPIGWTYFHILEDPITTLETYLEKKGDFQPYGQGSTWSPRTVDQQLADVDASLDAEQKVDIATLLDAEDEVFWTVNPLWGVEEDIGDELAEVVEEEVEALPSPVVEADAWTGELGPVLIENSALLDDGIQKIGERNVFLSKVMTQQHSWTCGFHSLHNAFRIIQFQQAVAELESGVLRAQQAEALKNNVTVQDRFKYLFLNGGELASPNPQSWLNVAESTFENVRQNGISADEQCQLLAKIKAEEALKPLQADIAIVDEIIPVGQFGPAESGYPVSENIPAFYQALLALQEDALVKAFTVGVGGAHFICCAVHRINGNLELVVADSLNRTLATNHTALTALHHWLEDPEGGLKDTFTYMHEGPIDTTISRDRPPTKEQWEGAIAFLEDCDLMEKPAYAPFRSKAEEHLDILTALAATDPEREKLAALKARLNL